MELRDDNVILRDFREDDIEDIIRWQTVERELQLWNLPWEDDKQLNTEEYREKIFSLLRKRTDEDTMKTTFQICINDESETHIGWCNVYKIDKDFKFTDGDGEYTVGIDIPEHKVRRKIYATAAWKLLIEYLLSHDIDNVYTQTWSGNYRLISLAIKVGFEECNRKSAQRAIRGNSYDGLTFKLNIAKFNKLNKK